MNSVKAMLFDLDGTLLDSAPDLVESLNRVRELEDLPPLELEEMGRFASKGAVGLLKAGMPETDPTTFEVWRQRFLEHYALNSFRHSSLFHGVIELLDYLDDAGVPWGIVTNKTESLTLPILEAAELDNRVDCVVCGDTLRESKPHPAPVRLACGMLEVPEASAIFVGDDIRDIEAGRAAGTQIAAVYYGYGSYEFDEEVVRGCYRIHHPADLTKLVR